MLKFNNEKELDDFCELVMSSPEAVTGYVSWACRHNSEMTIAGMKAYKEQQDKKMREKWSK